jgi:hypothetical protein
MAGAPVPVLRRESTVREAAYLFAPSRPNHRTFDTHQDHHKSTNQSAITIYILYLLQICFLLVQRELNHRQQYLFVILFELCKSVSLYPNQLPDSFVNNLTRKLAHYLVSNRLTFNKHLAHSLHNVGLCLVPSDFLHLRKNNAKIMNTSAECSISKTLYININLDRIFVRVRISKLSEIIVAIASSKANDDTTTKNTKAIFKSVVLVAFAATQRSRKRIFFGNFHRDAFEQWTTADASALRKHVIVFTKKKVRAVLTDAKRYRVRGHYQSSHIFLSEYFPKLHTQVRSWCCRNADK